MIILAFKSVTYDLKGHGRDFGHKYFFSILIFRMLQEGIFNRQPKFFCHSLSYKLYLKFSSVYPHIYKQQLRRFIIDVDVTPIFFYIEIDAKRR